MFSYFFKWKRFSSLHSNGDPSHIKEHFQNEITLNKVTVIWSCFSLSKCLFLCLCLSACPCLSLSLCLHLSLCLFLFLCLCLSLWCCFLWCQCDRGVQSFVFLLQFVHIDENCPSTSIWRLKHVLHWRPTDSRPLGSCTRLSKFVEFSLWRHPECWLDSSPCRRWIDNKFYSHLQSIVLFELRDLFNRSHNQVSVTITKATTMTNDRNSYEIN